jgi:hypothetical protein
MAIGTILTSLTLQHYGLRVHSWQFIPGLALFGIGMGFGFGSLFAAVLNGVDAGHAGSASGTLNAIQQVGAAIGVAVIGVIFFGQLSNGAAQSFSRVEPQLRQQLARVQVPESNQDEIVNAARTCYVDRTQSKDPSQTPESCKKLEQGSANQELSVQVESTVLRANAENFSHAFRAATAYSVIVLVGVFCLTFLLPRRFRAEAYNEAV